MKINKTIALALLLGFSAPHVFAAKPLPLSKKEEQRVSYGPKIRALIAKDVNSALLEVRGEYKVLNHENNTLLSYGSTGKRFLIHGMKEGLRWGEEYPDVFQIIAIPQSEQTTFFVDGIQYKGAMIVTQGPNYKITVVNDVSIEDFIKSTLAIKVSSPLSKEALAALAITERTEAYYQATKGNSSTRLWDIEAENVDYFGYVASICSKNLEQALLDTRFMVMKKSTGESRSEIPFQANWSLKKEANGLSLAAAEELSRKGYDAQKILKNYFPDAKIVTTCQPAPAYIR